MNSKLILTTLVFMAVSNLALAVKLPVLDITKINKLGCSSKDFGDGGFIIENLKNNSDQPVIQLDNGKRYSIYDLKVVNKKQINFSYGTSDMILEFSSTSWEADTNEQAYAVYKGMIKQLLQGAEGYPVSSVECSSMD